MLYTKKKITKRKEKKRKASWVGLTEKRVQDFPEVREALLLALKKQKASCELPLERDGL